ncbi:hypothetical protein N665_2203s0008 [Sinapis alba]|nr:hypothetical protein N665_2203s0008 [Sinapis alba]
MCLFSRYQFLMTTYYCLHVCEFSRVLSGERQKELTWEKAVPTHLKHSSVSSEVFIASIAVTRWRRLRMLSNHVCLSALLLHLNFVRPLPVLIPK